jgi:fructokinase
MDGFHLDNATLEARGLLSVKGAPETFDLVGFKRLINGLQSGAAKSFPTFDRDADSVVENGGSLSDEVSVLLFEGNYLLFDEGGWTDLADGWDASIWLEVPADVLQERLTRRWLDQGMSMEAALARARMNDLVNARRVIDKALPATWIVST